MPCGWSWISPCRRRAWRAGEPKLCTRSCMPSSAVPSRYPRGASRRPTRCCRPMVSGWPRGARPSGGCCTRISGGAAERSFHRTKKNLGTFTGRVCRCIGVARLPRPVLRFGAPDRESRAASSPGPAGPAVTAASTQPATACDSQPAGAKPITVMSVVLPESALPRIGMVSTHGYVAAEPPLGKADTGGQVVYVLELSKKLAQLGFEVDIWTRRFEDQPEMDVVNDRVRVIRVPCGGPQFLDKEYLVRHLGEWAESALRLIKRHKLRYQFFNSHYWDAGYATQRLAEALDVPHVHTPHSLGLWKKQLMEKDFPEDAANFEKKYNFTQRIHEETLLYRNCEQVIATTPDQADMIVKDYGAPAEQVAMIPPGYDDNRFFPVSTASRNTIRQRLGFEGRVVLAIGRLARNKGYDLLLDAFAVVAPREPNAVLHLAVGGTELNPKEQILRDELKAQADGLRLRRPGK